MRLFERLGEAFGLSRRDSSDETDRRIEERERMLKEALSERKERDADLYERTARESGDESLMRLARKTRGEAQALRQEQDWVAAMGLLEDHS